MNQYDRRI